MTFPGCGFSIRIGRLGGGMGVAGLTIVTMLYSVVHVAAFFFVVRVRGYVFGFRVRVCVFAFVAVLDAVVCVAVGFFLVIMVVVVLVVVVFVFIVVVMAVAEGLELNFGSIWTVAVHLVAVGVAVVVSGWKRGSGGLGSGENKLNLITSSVDADWSSIVDVAVSDGGGLEGSLCCWSRSCSWRDSSLGSVWQVAVLDIAMLVAVSQRSRLGVDTTDGARSRQSGDEELDHRR